MPKLKRTVGWKTFGLYGLGNILGAGIYVLIGEVAAAAGPGMIYSFIVAGVVASFTAISYSALAAKFPVSAGAAVYTDKAFRSKSFSTVIGLSLAFTGVVSASALARGFDRYFQELLQGQQLHVPSWLTIVGILAIMGFIAYRGIQESASIAVVLTLLEAAGLILIIVVAGQYASFSTAIQSSVASASTVEPMAIALGGFLAFYAFIGFEDMVNIAEEVKQPTKSIKKGMLGALIVASLLYIATAVASLAVLPAAELSASGAPLARVFSVASGSSLPVITIIGLCAVTNGILAQIIMSSRVLYGLAREGWLPKQLAIVSAKTKTPTTSTALSLGAIITGALLLPLGTLAQVTSFGLLIIFSIVQVAALKLIRKKLIRLHIAIPIIGLITNGLIIVVQVADWLSLT